MIDDIDDPGELARRFSTSPILVDMLVGAVRLDRRQIHAALCEALDGDVADYEAPDRLERVRAVLEVRARGGISFDEEAQALDARGGISFDEEAQALDAMIEEAEAHVPPGHARGRGAPRPPPDPRNPHRGARRRRADGSALDPLARVRAVVELIAPVRGPEPTPEAAAHGLSVTDADVDDYFAWLDVRATEPRLDEDGQPVCPDPCDGSCLVDPTPPETAPEHPLAVAITRLVSEVGPLLDRALALPVLAGPVTTRADVAPMASGHVDDPSTRGPGR